MALFLRNISLVRLGGKSGRFSASDLSLDGRGRYAPLFFAIRGRPVLPETLALTFLCVLDTFSTLYLVRSGRAQESNVLLQRAFAHSDAAFLAVKGATFLLPIATIELLRPLISEFIRRCLRWASVGYVAIYVVGSMASLWAQRL